MPILTRIGASTSRADIMFAASVFFFRSEAVNNVRLHGLDSMRAKSRLTKPSGAPRSSSRRNRTPFRDAHGFCRLE